LLPTTLVAVAIAISIASALFVTRQTCHCCHCPLCCCHRPSPDTLVAINIALAILIPCYLRPLPSPSVAFALFIARHIVAITILHFVEAAIAIVAIVCPSPLLP
jgi:hypothetical protein